MRLQRLQTFCFYRIKKINLLTRVLLLIGIFIFGFYTSGHSQQTTIAGIVTSDEKGVPLPGVSIVVQGKSKGTATDVNGRYSLSIPHGSAKIVFSYTGYSSQAINVNNRSSINVVLIPEAKQLSDVVVTALGITKEKRTVGYSTQGLSKKDLADARDVNVANYLTGKIAGVQVSLPASGVGGSSKVIIRGISSLTQENQPLYVVDGVPLDNTRYNEAGFSGGKDFGDGIGNINTEDIESINVLKGPNATALYGSRGSNGVILITTKTGKAGKGIGVEVNSNVTFEKINLIPNVQNKYGAGYEDKNIYGSMISINGTNYETVDDWHTDSYGPPLDGKLLVVNPFVSDPGAPKATFVWSPQPKNNIRDFWETGLVTNNSVALSGGSEKSSARLSFANTTIKGITPRHNENHQSINLRVATNITDRLSFDAKATYMHKNVNNAPTLGATSENLVNTLVRLGRFVPLDFLKQYYEKTGKYGNFPNVPYNPYYVINELHNNASRDRVVAFVSAKYQFNNWLSLMARSGIDTYSERRRQTWPVGARSSANSKGRIVDETFITKESNTDVLLTASKEKLFKNFSASLSIGASLLQRNYRTQSWDARTFKVPGIYDVSNTKDVFPNYSLVRREMQSAYFSGEIGYKNYLFLNVTGRNDWSSTLGENNYSFFYPSMTGSFIFTDAFHMRSKVLTYGKLRASYATAGNDASPYLTKTGYLFNSIPYNGQYAATESNTIALFDLKNELKKSIEVGTELRLFGDRIGVDVTYYKSNTKNQIVPITISSGSGYSTKIVNAGNIENKGIEIALRTTPVQLRNSFRWDVSFNYARNHSKVIDLAPGLETFPLYTPYNPSNNIEARVGQPFGNIVGYGFKRSPDGERIVGSDGSYQRDDTLKVLGNVTPKWVGGLNNTFSFKGFTLGVLVDFVQGNKINSSTKYQMEAGGIGAFTERYREQSEPLPGVVEKIDANGGKSYSANTQKVDGQTAWASRAWGEIGEEFVLDGSFVMLREVILGYTLQPSFLKKTPFTSLRVSLAGRNLWYIKEHMQGMGISPEVNLNTQAGATGVEALSMPTTRSYGINVNFTF
ncbi:MAG: SusC/RagA family TonB-linked outer membrane protein [Ferruginibacter sp.]